MHDASAAVNRPEPERLNFYPALIRNTVRLTGAATHAP
ncbi:hypothetical protein SUDANB38_02669 [Streptomyces sp. enrichment culture]